MIVRSVFSAVVAVSLFAAPAFAQTNEKYKQVSEKYVAEANVALKSENNAQAQVLFERAIVANPANVTALIGLGQTHEAEGRIGRSLKYYRHALEIEPNALPALEAQALAFLKRDMIDRAESNLSKLSRLCPNGCKALDTVETSIEGYKARKADEDQKEQG
ncbi:tetratricopeptide repeat protein [Kordiimonas laminariae]|uniref:tetratricopeptide repeat protein n=1 Tax=Kordiimonas laminariae TaxID=2917717 RepID=UPI001FF49C4A|nr:tetratricopeptide repeat protein [Kordiimonas laminariae]MCK0069816.1 hypothetical protein [Kordiimonas laminariae]